MEKVLFTIHRDDERYDEEKFKTINEAIVALMVGLEAGEHRDMTFPCPNGDTPHFFIANYLGGFTNIPLGKIWIDHRLTKVFDDI